MLTNKNYINPLNYTSFECRCEPLRSCLKVKQEHERHRKTPQLLVNERREKEWTFVSNWRRNTKKWFTIHTEISPCLIMLNYFINCICKTCISVSVFIRVARLKKRYPSNDLAHNAAHQWISHGRNISISTKIMKLNELCQICEIKFRFNRLNNRWNQYKTWSIAKQKHGRYYHGKKVRTQSV